jgi:hypothetical protein
VSRPKGKKARLFSEQGVRYGIRVESRPQSYRGAKTVALKGDFHRESGLD